MWNVIRELVASGVTLVLTAQYLDEADELADQRRWFVEAAPAAVRG